jgi:O-antigen ligase
MAAAALAALLVLSVGLTDGGYYGQAYTALTILLCSGSLLAVLGGVARRPSRAASSTLAALGFLTAWSALSAAWAVPGANVDLETRRSVLYLVAFASVVVTVDARRRRPFLAGLLAAIVVVGVVAVGLRAASGPPVDRFYGNLLEEPVGYPNALGVLVAIGAVLGIGLAVSAGGRVAAVGHAVPAFLVFVLGLTGSRGGAVALALGLAALVLLLPAERRVGAIGAAVFALAVGGCAGAVAGSTGPGGPALALMGAASLAAAVLVAPVVRRLGARAVALAGIALVAVVVAATLVHPPGTTSSFRTAYWKAALAETRERPVLGSGAGTFYLTWREHRTVGVGVRDAHSLYVETLSELGPVGLALVLALVGVPLGVAVRGRGDPLVATATAGFVVFVVHAGVDWDWEMPVVTLAALGCAGAAFARSSRDCERGKR